MLKQLQDLRQSVRIVGLLILGNLALITTTTVTVSITITVTVAVISLTQQLHTAQYFDTMSGTVLTLALNLGKLHNQTQTMEHSQLDFIATRVANDFFHAFSNFISGKNILSTILSCTAVGALILLLIIIPPYIVRILQQNIQNLTTELHMAVLRNKKGGDAGSQHRESRTWPRS